MVVITFLLPFMVVSCGDTEVLSLSGYRLATGSRINNPLLDSDARTALRPNIFAIISIIVAVVGLIAAFRLTSDKYIVPLILAAIGFISLVLLKKGMGVNDLGSIREYADAIGIKYKYRYYLSLLAFLLAFLSELLPKYRYKYLRDLQDFTSLFYREKSTTVEIVTSSTPTAEVTIDPADTQDNVEDSHNLEDG
jgi:hypothetical protein